MDKEYSDNLLSLPNVRGVGKGFKEVKGVRTTQHAVVVLVSKKLPREQLSKEELVPKIIDGCQTSWIVLWLNP